MEAMWAGRKGGGKADEVDVGQTVSKCFKTFLPSLMLTSGLYDKHITIIKVMPLESSE
jgi:hypothetical protein